MTAARRWLVAAVAAGAVTVGSLHAATMTPAGYSRAIARICAGALLFDGRHEIGTRAGAVAVARDIRATGNRRLRRVDAVAKPPATDDALVRWIATERQLVDLYAVTYLRIWNEIERARTPHQRAQLPLVLHRLVHAPDSLKLEAGTLELNLDVPDCTGG
jgi:hypothetical protein